MPARVYRLVLKDPDLKKLAPSSQQIGIYTTHTVKIVGSCIFYQVHPDTKKLHEVTFFVVGNDGSVLQTFTRTFVLGLIQQRTRLDYLTSRASLITSSVDHPKKTKCQVTVHSSSKGGAVSQQRM